MILFARFYGIHYDTATWTPPYRRLSIRSDRHFAKFTNGRQIVIFPLPLGRGYRWFDKFNFSRAV